MIDPRQKRKCIVAIDAMGGDFAPLNELRGAALALKEIDNVEVVLVGNEKLIRDTASKESIDLSKIPIVDAQEVINMSDTPTAAIRKKPNSSLVIGANLVKDKKADAFVSAGNTGAMLAAATLLIGRIKGVGRPTIGASYPTQTGKFTTVFDSGSSVDSKPSHLFEYAIMGSIFAGEIYNYPNPSIGLLNVGEEESKGNELALASHQLLKNSKLNFFGNVEGRDIFKGKVDIVVCDGFTGNVVLKLAESVIGFLKIKIKQYADKGLINSLKALVVKNVLRVALKDMDYQSHGGVPVLGVNGIAIVGHGSSSPLAIKNMVLRAKEMYDKNLIEKMEEAVNRYAVN